MRSSSSEERAYIEKVCRRIRGARALTGLSQERLAARAEISRETLRLLEGMKRTPTLEVCWRLSRVLGVPMSVLVAEEK